MSVFVNMTEEEVARRWLSDNNLVAVSWEVVNALVSPQINDPIVYFDPSTPTYKMIKDHARTS